MYICRFLNEVHMYRISGYLGFWLRLFPTYSRFYALRFLGRFPLLCSRFSSAFSSWGFPVFPTLQMTVFIDFSFSAFSSAFASALLSIFPLCFQLSSISVSHILPISAPRLFRNVYYVYLSLILAYAYLRLPLLLFSFLPNITNPKRFHALHHTQVSGL
jgi:hypothetical protein